MDTDGICPACVAGDHDRCVELGHPFDSCLCIDMEHDVDPEQRWYALHDGWVT